MDIALNGIGTGTRTGTGKEEKRVTQVKRQVKGRFRYVPPKVRSTFYCYSQGGRQIQITLKICLGTSLVPPAAPIAYCLLPVACGQICANTWVSLLFTRLSVLWSMYGLDREIGKYLGKEAAEGNANPP